MLHPITNSDIWAVEKGESILHKNGTTTAIVKDGWVLSDFYIEQVVKAKVKQ